MKNNNGIMAKMSASDAWQALLDKYDIKNEIENNGIFRITASQIKEVREPRLMAKWDSSEQLPSSLKKNKINILPDSRSSYILSDFILYERLPELTECIQNMPTVTLPELETIDVENITSEANAINVLQISGILEDFLELDHEEILYGTFDGRMSSGIFNFNVNTYRGISRTIEVNKAQMEIDGGFESEHNIIILEAKNVLHEDFHVRQLYYPFRLWDSKVNKPIRLIFSIYTNKIFRLMEYRFKDKNNYSSIELVRAKNYSLEDTTISIEELKRVYDSVEAHNIIKDDMTETDVPFIQADNFERIISLLENMYEADLNGEEIEELMQFTSRQTDYYYNAGKYLGIFEKYKDDDRVIKYRLTGLGRLVYSKNYKARQLLLVELILSHQIFRDLFIYVKEIGELPNKEIVKTAEIKYNVCSFNVADRRASTVISWLRWIFNLPNL
ncbi:type II restriction enzyme [Lactococcus lactis]|uniref:Type II restriction endonuclease n=1 Tax=Lactococcus lactis subsp. lactis TaxID=1360 RepID=A0A1V0P4N6_LACLL|nr:type II restriction endonuclease [Lactococcus lactis]ARE21687.1 type II restriction endonuclease [Lactococcus lactis subsp. lactis]